MATGVGPGGDDLRDMDKSGEKAPSDHRGYADPISAITALHAAHGRELGITAGAA
jgi:hypothetical protein